MTRGEQRRPGVKDGAGSGGKARSRGGGLSPARRVALEALLAMAGGRFAGDALDEAMAAHRQPLSRADRALATEIAYGVARRQGTLDYYLGHVSRRPLGKLDRPLLQILRAALYELFFLDRVPDRAVVHQAVEAARLHGGEGAARFTNGVLRNLLRQRETIPVPQAGEDPEGYLAIVHSHPRYLVRRWLARFPFQEALALCQANNRVPPLTIRVNRLRAQPHEVQEELAAAGVTAQPGNWLPEALVLEGTAGIGPAHLPNFQNGHYTFQDEASMLVSRVVAPQPGEKVLDACSAPGTKTTHMAELMGDQGRVVAVDIDPHRLAKVTEGARRLGLAAVEARPMDARDLPRHYDAQFDRVLVDAPCTGFGTLTRRPDLRWQKQEEDIAALARLQGEIVAAAAQVVKPGGVLVYTVCTNEPEETYDIVRAFLAGQGNFAPDALAPYLPEPLVSDARDHQLMLWPHRHGTDGFFMARMRRIH